MNNSKNKYMVVFFSSSGCGACHHLKKIKDDERIKKICKNNKVEFVEILIENTEQMNSIHPFVTKNNLIIHLPYFLFTIKEIWEDHESDFFLGKEIPGLRTENSNEILKNYIKYYENTPVYKPVRL